MDLVEKEAIKLTAMLLATEKRAKGFTQVPEQHKNLINAQANLLVTLTKYFKNMAKHAGNLVNWDHYNYQKLDFNVDVIINEDEFDNYDGQFIKLTLNPVTKMAAAGFTAAEVINNKPLGIPSTNAIIQKLGTEQVAKLVGKKVMPDGSIVDNPKAEYNINETVRNDIAQSIKTSLALGETTEEATARMQEIIDDPYRAELIANTEAVNAFNSGIMEFGNQSDAVAKEWDDAGSNDECADNAAQDPIPLDEDFDSGDPQPPAHPNCLCSLRLIYQDELDNADSTDDTVDE